MYTFQDENVKDDIHVVGFFEGLTILEDEEGNLFVSKIFHEDLEIGEYLDDPDKIPLSNFEDEFQKVIGFLFE